MNSSTRIPPLLQPYVQLPRDDSLLLLTSTLGASANWLLIRFLCNALSNSQDGGVEGHNVVLVSWMRDYDFWRQEARKGGGLDLERLKREKRFAFVDGLSELVMGEGKTQKPARQMPSMPPRPQQPQTGFHPARLTQVIDKPQGTGNILPVRGPPGRTVPGRGPPAPAQPTSPATTVITPSQPSASSQTPGHFTLTSLDLAHLKTTLTAAITSLSTPTNTRKTLLVFDTPDAYLALSSTAPSTFVSLLLQLHAKPSMSHILTHIHADTPLISPSAPAQPLEVSQVNLLTKLAHMSTRVIGTRVLDTGVARDVSGVVRVTEQRTGWQDLGLEEEGNLKEGDAEKGKEFLYQVKGDGSVKVFERGAGSES
jgi:elongator complex protein 6